MGIKIRPRLLNSLFKKLSFEDACFLDQPFTFEEIKEAVWSCGGEKSSGPDGFTFKLIKHFWDVIGNDIISLVKEFEKSNIYSKRMQFVIYISYS